MPEPRDSNRNENWESIDLEEQLTWAVDYGQEGTVDSLLKYGVNPNFVRSELNTPLHLAVSNENIDIARLLVSHGASINQKDWLGYTPLHYCCTSKTQRGRELSTWLISLGAKVDIEAAVSLGRVDDLITLLQHGEMQQSSASGKLLSNAVLSGSKKVLSLLLENGITPSNHSADASLALCLAVECNNPDMLRTLLEAGANPNAPINSYSSVLDWAEKTGQRHHFIELLKKSGAK